MYCVGGISAVGERSVADGHHQEGLHSAAPGRQVRQHQGRQTAAAEGLSSRHPGQGMSEA